MPRFFFHLATPLGTELDDIGIEFPDLHIAYLEACCAIPGVAFEILSKGKNPADHAFHVSDEAGNVLWVVPLLERVPKRVWGAS